jgi:hypothetical protein
MTGYQFTVVALYFFTCMSFGVLAAEALLRIVNRDRITPQWINYLHITAIVTATFLAFTT